jgi:hypothetical protein
VGDVGIGLGPPPTRPTVLIRYPAAAMRKIGAVELWNGCPAGAAAHKPAS